MLQKSAMFHKVTIFFLYSYRVVRMSVKVYREWHGRSMKSSIGIAFHGWLRDSPSFNLHPFDEKRILQSMCGHGRGGGGIPPQAPISFLVTYKPFSTLIYFVPSPRLQPHGHPNYIQRAYFVPLSRRRQSGTNHIPCAVTASLSRFPVISLKSKKETLAQISSAPASSYILRFERFIRKSCHMTSNKKRGYQLIRN